jgi:error-prone DNA polymerase
LGREAAERIVRARQTGPFLGVEDVVERARLHRGEVSALAEAGAFAVWGMGRREALWKGAAPRGEGLFAGLALGDGMPALPQVTRAQQLMLDYERTGISVADHPMRLWRDKLPRAIKSSLELGKMSHGQSVVTAGMVICRQRPQTASGVVFVSLEDEHGFINVVVFAQIFEQYRYVTTTSGMLVVHGKVEREKHVIYVVASRLERLSMPGGGAFSMSRDFH